MNNLRIYISIALFFCTHELWASSQETNSDQKTMENNRQETLYPEFTRTPESSELTFCQKCYTTHTKSTHLHSIPLKYKGGYCGTCIRNPHWIPCCLFFTCWAALADWQTNSPTQN